MELFAAKLFTLDDFPVESIDHKTCRCDVAALLSKLPVFTAPTDTNGTPAPLSCRAVLSGRKSTYSRLLGGSTFRLRACVRNVWWPFHQSFILMSLYTCASCAVVIVTWATSVGLSSVLSLIDFIFSCKLDSLCSGMECVGNTVFLGAVGKTATTATVSHMHPFPTHKTQRLSLRGQRICILHVSSSRLLLRLRVS